MKDRPLRAATNNALLALADGRPLVWAARLKGVIHPAHVRGIDLMRATCRAAAREGLSVYFYGGAPGVPELVSRSLVEECPGLAVGGWESPPFRPQVLSEDAASTKRIRDSGARILWVGLGAPKQESWMVAHRTTLPDVVMIGVGAASDFQAGRFREAPRWMQQAGLEWMHRLLRNPTRLWRRYLYTNTLFLFHGTLELTGVRSYGGDLPGEEV